MALSQKDSRVKMAAARNTLKSLGRVPKITLESVRRPPNSLCLRENDSSPSEDDSKQTKILYSYCSWQGEMAFAFDEFEDFFQKKVYPSSRYDNPGGKKNFRRAAAKFHSWERSSTPWSSMEINVS
ncbi:hypothetical protein PoB_005172500 [Plakobranchus ocellatus]|uniref:Uncharacterized protein n=1 Tax=Plakobranchus ocellatus TaxID=259542 RepID=A0AAV4C0T6_9GAST|nr:hypothetical protein PoB_005172500 [Plakobranchus ocellatus]